MYEFDLGRADHVHSGSELAGKGMIRSDRDPLSNMRNGKARSEVSATSLDEHTWTCTGLLTMWLIRRYPTRIGQLGRLRSMARKYSQ